MATFRYRAVGADGVPFAATIEAGTLYEATDEIRASEAELLAIELVGGPAPRPLPALADGPSPAPREVPSGVTGAPGGFVLLIVGGVFMAVALVFVVIGLSLLAAGNTDGVWFALFPLIHLTVGSVLVFFALRRRRQRRHLYREGRAVVATVERTGFDQSVRINGRHPYKLWWRFDVAGQVCIGTRSTRNEPITAYAAGDQIWVLYDPDDPDESVEWPPM